MRAQSWLLPTAIASTVLLAGCTFTTSTTASSSRVSGPPSSSSARSSAAPTSGSSASSSATSATISGTFHTGQTLLSDKMASNTNGWPTDPTANSTRSFAAGGGYTIKGLTKGYDFYTSPDETGLSLTNIVVQADLDWGLYLGSKNATGVYCRNANGSRYIFQIQESPSSSTPGNWAIIRDDSGTAKTLKEGTSTELSGSKATVAGGCVTDSAGVTHLGMSVNGTIVGKVTDASGLPEGKAGVYLSTPDSTARITVDEFKLFRGSVS